MKKLILFIATTLTLLSCSNDDNKTHSEFKVTIDGIEKTFNSISVNKSTETNTNGTFTHLDIKAVAPNNSSEYISFTALEGEIGEYSAWDFLYKNNDTEYHGISTGMLDFSLIMEVNNNRKLKGTFSGNLYTYNVSPGAMVELTHGFFDISF